MKLPFDRNAIVRGAANLGVVLLVASSAHAAPKPSFMGLGHLYPQREPSVAFGVSADGSVVVGRSTNSTGNGADEAFRWTEEAGMVGLGDLSGGEFDSTASAVSGDGSIVVGYGTSATSQPLNAVRWTQATGMMSLGDLPGGLNHGAVGDISADGTTIVGLSSSSFSGAEAFRWTQATGMVGLGVPSSAALGVSADGSVIVGYMNSSPRPFRWTAETGAVNLGLPPNGSNRGFAQDVSADGSVVVGYTERPTGENQGFVWREGEGYQTLGFLVGHTQSEVHGLSADGTRFVGYSRGGGNFKAVIWNGAHRIRDLKEMLELDFGLDLTGWELWEAYAISADGTTIVGGGENPQGAREAWRAVIPEPASAFIVVAALLLHPRRRFRSCEKGPARAT
ncbi:MAG: PEP-CTERM sorting domain-containing protein [Planctomycetota bacterium]|nr:MAG: PEP-CTERM sorting domain-containing protein [Planctomycetota bacterium]